MPTVSLVTPSPLPTPEPQIIVALSVTEATALRDFVQYNTGELCKRAANRGNVSEANVCDLTNALFYDLHAAVAEAKRGS